MPSVGEMASLEHRSPSATGSDSGSDARNPSAQRSGVNPSRIHHGPLSFGQSSVTSGSAGGGGAASGTGVPERGGVRQRSISTATGEGAAAYWDSLDLSRRPNIHRSHLSSSIQTGSSFKRLEIC